MTFANRACKICGAQYAPTGPSAKYCIPCGTKRKKALAVKFSLDWQCARNPNKQRGVGSGGAQWGQANHRWKPLDQHKSTKYRGNYRTRCARYWDMTVCAACLKSARTQVHHINGDPDDVSPNNLIPLCVGCHLYKVHRKKWSVTDEYVGATLAILSTECRSKIAELSGKAETPTRTEGCESSQGQSIEGEIIPPRGRETL